MFLHCLSHFTLSVPPGAPAPTLCGHLLWRFAIQQQSILRLSLVTLCSHKSGGCAVELYHASHLWYPPSYTSPMASSALQH